MTGKNLDIKTSGRKIFQEERIANIKSSIFKEHIPLKNNKRKKEASLVDIIGASKRVRDVTGKSISFLWLPHYHKLGDIKQQKCILLQFWKLEV